MGITLKKSLALNLDALGRSASAAGREAFGPSWMRDTAEAMALRLEARLVHDVFGQQRTPEGQPWVSLAPLTLALRRAEGRGNTKAGTGPKNAMIRSLQLGNPDNHFEVLPSGFEYGSSLTRGGHNVLEAFQTASRTPASDDEVKREAVRGYMLAVVGIPAPGPGKHLAKPPRRALSLPPAWMQELLQVGQERARDTFLEAASDAMRQADFEVEQVRNRTPELAGGVQFF